MWVWGAGTGSRKVRRVAQLPEVARAIPALKDWRERGGCRFGSHCSLDNVPPHRPNPRAAFLTLVEDAAFLTPGEQCWPAAVVSLTGARRWERRWRGLEPGSGCESALVALGRLAEGKAHPTCWPQLPIPGTQALLQSHSGKGAPQSGELLPLIGKVLW